MTQAPPSKNAVAAPVKPGPKRGSKKKPEAGNPDGPRLRVQEWRRVTAQELQANPRNWRNHPPEQRAALRAVMERVGFVGAALSYVDPVTGAETLLDGHLRLEEMQPTDQVWVGRTDLTPAEADYLLTVFDPLAALATGDGDRLAELLGSIQEEDQAVLAMLHSVAQSAGVELPAALSYMDPATGAETLLDGPQPRPGQSTDYEEHFAVLVQCTGEAHQQQVYADLMDAGYSCKVLVN